MSKRFTESEKWRDAWFRKLPPAAKLLWLYLLDTCDAAGVFEMDADLASFQIGLPMGIETLSELGDRVEHLGGEKYWIPRFIEFQVGTPSADCRAHNPIFQSIKKHKLDRVLKGYPILSDRDKDKDKDKDKDGIGGEGGKGAAPPTEAEVRAYAANGSTVPIPTDCALRWLTDREVSDWHRPKGQHMLPVLPNWQADLRGYAMDWNKNEAERRAKNGNRTTQPRRRDNATLNAEGRYD